MRELEILNKNNDQKALRAVINVPQNTVSSIDVKRYVVGIPMWPKSGSVTLIMTCERDLYMYGGKYKGR